MKQIKDIKDNYQVDKVSYKEIAQAMDFINEYTIKFYCRSIDGETDPHTIHSNFYKRNKKINSVIFQFAIDIMLSEGFIEAETIPGESSTIKNFLYTKKGIDKYFHGGFMREIKRENRKKWLMVTGQISIIIAGLYYLFALIKFCA